MHWYTVVKTIKKRRYRYRQRTWRVGKCVRCESHYLGPCNTSLIGFHGTFAQFNKFDPCHLGSGVGGADTQGGFFFASNRRVAISYASTELAAKRGLYATMGTLTARIEALTGLDNPFKAEEELESGTYAHDKARENKIKSYLQRRRRASSRLD